MRSSRLRWLPMAVACHCVDTHAADALSVDNGAEPLYVRNLSPIAGLLGLPSQRSAVWRAGLQTAVHGSLSNQFVEEENGGEVLRLDSETTRLALELRYGFAQGWDLQLELPWLRHEGGFLDAAIDNWHHFWGMSDGGRPGAPRDRLDFGYRGEGGGFRLLEDVSGPGDISLSANRVLHRGAAYTLGFGLGYKFATGDDDDFLGSGEEDLFATLRASGTLGGERPLRWHGQLGYLWAGEFQPIEGVAEDGLWYAGAALDWGVWRTVSLQLQLDLHAAPADSAITGIGDDAVMLSLGLRWAFHPRWTVDFNVVEDPAVETAPDIVFQTSLRYRPG